MVDINSFDEWTKQKLELLSDYAPIKIPPIDENLFNKKVSSGMLPEVVLGNHEREHREKVKDFVYKEFTLRAHSNQRELSYYQFMDFVYGDTDEFVVVTADTSYTTMNRDDLLDYMQWRDDIYVAPCTFIHGCYRADTCRDVYALVIDIDKVKPDVISNVLNNGNIGTRIPMPSIITNSGNGLHFYYVLEQKVPYFKKQRLQLQDIYRRLFHVIKENISSKADWHSIIQPFRLPGSMTKLGLVATAYQFNDKWKIEELAERIGFKDLEWDFSEREVVSRQEHRENIKNWKKKQEVVTGEKKKTKRMKLRAGLKGFYDYSLNRTYQKTKEGSRYRSLVALTMIGYKAGIPKEELRKDFEKLLVHFNSIGEVFKPKEIDKALRTYNTKALKVRSTTLEELFDWEFERWRAKAEARSKKKKRSQTEHLRRARALQSLDDPNGSWRNKKGQPTKKEIVLLWRNTYPEGRKIDCERETGLSRKTVLKWWNEADEEGL